MNQCPAKVQLSLESVECMAESNLYFLKSSIHKSCPTAVLLPNLIIFIWLVTATARRMNWAFKNTKLYSIEFLSTEMTSDPRTEIENTSRKTSVLYNNLRGVPSFLSSILNRAQFCVLQVFYYTLFRGLEPKLYSISTLGTVFHGEIYLGEDNVYYKKF